MGKTSTKKEDIFDTSKVTLKTHATHFRLISPLGVNWAPIFLGAIWQYSNNGPKKEKEKEKHMSY